MARGENKAAVTELAKQYGPTILRGIANWWRARRQRKAAERELRDIIKKAETEDVSGLPAPDKLEPVDEYGEGGRQ
jgi:hypothetical protein